MSLLDQIIRKMREYEIAERGDRPHTWVISEEQWHRLRDECHWFSFPESPDEVTIGGAHIIIVKAP